MAHAQIEKAKARAEGPMGPRPLRPYRALVPWALWGPVGPWSLRPSRALVPLALYSPIGPWPLRP